VLLSGGIQLRDNVRIFHFVLFRTQTVDSLVYAHLCMWSGRMGVVSLAIISCPMQGCGKETKRPP
jgi:hypothetical protein